MRALLGGAQPLVGAAVAKAGVGEAPAHEVHSIHVAQALRGQGIKAAELEAGRVEAVQQHVGGPARRARQRPHKRRVGGAKACGEGRGKGGRGRALGSSALMAHDGPCR